MLCAAIQVAFAGTRRSSLWHHLRYSIVECRRYGLAAFLLPPLRALGLEHGTVHGRDRLVGGLRYPVSTAVAALHELPRGYYSRRADRLAWNAKTDAWAFLDQLICAPVEKEGTEECHASRLFTDIVVESGRVVCERLLSEAYDSVLSHDGRNTVTSSSVRGGGEVNSLTTVGIDVLSCLFFGILRFCAQVGLDEDYASVRQGWLHRMLCRLREVLAEARPSREISPQEAELLEDLWGRFTTTRGTMKKDKDKSGEDNSGRAWEKWLWSIELEDVDEQPLSDAKALLRSCHATFADGPSQGMTLLRLRATFDGHGELLKTARAEALRRMRSALQNDVIALRKEAPGDELMQRNPPILIDADDSKKEPSNDGDETAKMAVDGGGGGGSEEQANPTGENKTEKAAAKNSADGLANAPLSDAASRGYFERMITAILRRAMLSPVDGAVAGAALRLFLVVARDFFAPLALAALLRRLMRQLTAVFMRPSRSLLECRSLAVLLHDVAEGVVLPYRRSYAAESGGEFAGILPTSEKEANSLMSHTLSDLHAMIRYCLGKGTFLGDWAGFFVVQHVRWLIRPVAKYDEAFNRCILARREALGRAQILSLGFQALMKVEQPLLEGMSEPAARVADLFTRRPAPTTTTSIPPSGPVGRGGGGGGRQDRKAAVATPAHGKRGGESRGGDPHLSTAIPTEGGGGDAARGQRRWREGTEYRKRERERERERERPINSSRGEDVREQGRREPSRERSRRHRAGRHSRRH
ncbi:unnamed protein product [Phytomonas sp. EM1]|nr:unnamed protein product [Phytomonas sp. EM1]|eukprot:CCW64354.1 unnamed protein product [Phytomonas sp. isolate EM1]